VYSENPFLQEDIAAQLGADALWFANICIASYGSNTRQFLHHVLINTRSQLRSNLVLADELISGSHLVAEFNHPGLGFCEISSHDHDARAARAC
jgi:hypothetical protein